MLDHRAAVSVHLQRRLLADPALPAEAEDLQNDCDLRSNTDSWSKGLG